MSNLYETEHGKGILIYTSNHHILLRNKAAEQFSRPTILAADYQSNLTETIYNGTIYYSYLNERYQIIIKTIASPYPLYKLENDDHPVCSNPQIIVFCKQLMLFYILENPITHKYTIKCVFPFHNDLSLSLDMEFQDVPKLQLHLTEKMLFLDIQMRNLQKYLGVDFNYQITELVPLSQEQLLHSQEINYQALQEKTKRLQAEIDEKNSEINRLGTVIQSATKQYNELMEVAISYREEANKWRKKFYY